MVTFEFVSNELCPYTQRAVIQLLEKGVSYTRTYIDLANKPAWFLQISPSGRVPLLRAGDAVLFESSAICEYLEEAAAGRPLHPEAPLERARHRAWIEFASAITADIYAMYTAPDHAAFNQKATVLKEKFRRLEAELGASPYFAGEAFALVDAAFAPVFRLFDTFDRIGDFEILSSLERVRTYRSSLAARGSVQRAVLVDYHARFARYLAARGSYLARLVPPALYEDSSVSREQGLSGA